jgi:hypothetical protein
MLKQNKGTRAAVAFIMAAVLMLTPGAPILRAQGFQPSVNTPAIDGGWPRVYTTPLGATLVVYQPQVSEWAQQQRMTLRAAVSYTPDGGKEVLGTITAVADTRVSLEDRLVDFSVFKITEANFSELSKQQVQ